MKCFERTSIKKVYLVLYNKTDKSYMRTVIKNTIFNILEVQTNEVEHPAKERKDEHR